MKTLLMFLFIFPLLADSTLEENPINRKQEILNRLNEAMPVSTVVQFVNRESCSMKMIQSGNNTTTNWYFNILDLNFDDLSLDANLMCDEYRKCISYVAEEITDRNLVTTAGFHWTIPFERPPLNEESLRKTALALTELYNECIVKEEEEETQKIDHHPEFERWGAPF